MNAPQTDGATALHWAAYREDLAMVDLLLKAGANVKVANQYGSTPLSLAAENGNSAIVQRLLDAGADPNERLLNRDRADDGDPHRQHRDDEAAARSQRRREREGNRAGHDGADVGGGAASGGRPVTRRPQGERRRGVGPGLAGPARELRQSLDPRPSRKRGLFGNQIGPRNQRDRRGGGLTPLVFAVRSNDLESVRILLAAGADVNQVTNYGWSPCSSRRRIAITSSGRFCSTTVRTRTSPTKVPGRPVYRGRQPQYRRRGLSDPQAGHGSPGLHQEADRQRCQRQLAESQESTWYRTVFTSQWVHEDGATAFWRASQSSDL